MLIRLSAFPWSQIDERQVINLEALQDSLQKDAREVLAPKQLSRLLHVRHRPVQHTTCEGGKLGKAAKLGNAVQTAFAEMQKQGIWYTHSTFLFVACILYCFCICCVLIL
jgi:hypothetical protein